MNMYDFASIMEHDAEHLYRDLALKAPSSGVKEIFNMLADDEKKHERAVEILKNKYGAHDLDETFLPEVTTVFEDMRQHLDDIELSTDELDDYKLALKMEKRGFAYYKEQLGRMGDDESLHLLRCIANQELYHIKTLENLIDMLERPQWWIENAEFSPEDGGYL